MEDERTILEKILDGEATLGDYDLTLDFDHDEICKLLEAGILDVRDLPDGKASDMILDGSLSYDEYPFENFSHYEQVRQLEQEAVSREDFKARAELESYDGDEWLQLLDIWPELETEAPWEMIRKEARAESWFDFLSFHPEYADKADWKRIFEEGKMKKYFDMLAKQPDLFAYCPDKEKLLEEDSALWVELLIRQPGFAEIHPLKDFDKVYEIEHLLLHRPELAGMLTWEEDNPPVKLYIVNNMPDGMKKFFPDSAWFVSTEKSMAIQKILQDILFYGKQDAERQANVIAHDCRTFAGVFSTRTAESIMKNFESAVAESRLPLSIGKESEFSDKEKFTAKNELEEDILKKKNAKIIQSVVEANSRAAAHTNYLCRADMGYGLKRPDILATEEFFDLPIRTAAVVYECGMNYCLRQKALLFMRNCFPESEVNELLNDVEESKKREPSEEEQKLLAAIRNGNDQEVCRLIEKEEICLRSMTQESMTTLFNSLKKLDNPYTTVLLFKEGIHYASAAVFLKFLLRECEREKGLDDMDYKERLMYTNLLIHVLQEEITLEDDDLVFEDWYPMGNSIKDGRDHRVFCHTYSYYFDPQHIYEPRSADGEYKKPKHSIH